MRARVAILAAAFGLFLISSTASATPIAYLGSLPNGIPVSGIEHQPRFNPSNPEGADYWQFFATAGTSIDLFGDRQVGNYDMSYWVFNGVYADTSAFGGDFGSFNPGFILFADDQDPPNIPGPFGDPHAIFTAPITGFYTVAVTNFDSDADLNGYPYTLTARGVDAVPEPASMVLIGTGLLGLAGLRRRFGR